MPPTPVDNTHKYFLAAVVAMIFVIEMLSEMKLTHGE